MFTLITKAGRYSWSLRDTMTKNSLQEMLTDYTQKIYSVTDYCSRFYKLSLPTLKKADWIDGTVVENFSKAKVIPSLWLNNGILSQLTWVPESIIKYDSMYQTFEKEIAADLQEIIDSQEPPSPSKKAHLAVEIENLSQQVGALSQGSESIISNLTDFSKRIASAKAFFDNLYTKVASEEKADEDKVKAIQGEIDNLNAELTRLNNLEIAMLVCETAGSAAVVFAMFFEIEWLEFVATVFTLATTIASIALDVEIANTVEKLDADRLELDDYTFDLTQISALRSSLEYLNSSVDAAISAVKDISTLWNELGTELKNLSSKLHDEEEYIDKEEFSKLLEDIKATQSDWNEIVNIAKQIRLLNMEPDLDADPVEIKFKKCS